MCLSLYARTAQFPTNSNNTGYKILWRKKIFRNMQSELVREREFPYIPYCSTNLPWEYNSRCINATTQIPLSVQQNPTKSVIQGHMQQAATFRLPGIWLHRSRFWKQLILLCLSKSTISLSVFSHFPISHLFSPSLERQLVHAVANDEHNQPIS